MAYILFYIVGCLSVMAAMAMVAIAKGQSHGMSPAAMALLVFSAGALWPLLAVAVVQVVGLLGLAKGPGLLRVRSRRKLPPVALATEVEMVAAV